MYIASEQGQTAPRGQNFDVGGFKKNEAFFYFSSSAELFKGFKDLFVSKLCVI